MASVQRTDQSDIGAIGIEEKGLLRRLVGMREFGILLAAERTGRILRHRDADALEEVADGQAVPAGEELAARERRRHLTARQFAAMAGGAFLRIQPLAAGRLLFRINAFPDRVGRRLCLYAGIECQNRCQREQGHRCKFKFHVAIVQKKGPVSRAPTKTDNPFTSRLKRSAEPAKSARKSLGVLCVLCELCVRHHRCSRSGTGTTAARSA